MPGLMHYAWNPSRLECFSAWQIHQRFGSDENAEEDRNVCVYVCRLGGFVCSCR